MRRLAAAIFTALVGPACSSTEPAGPVPVPVAIGTEFSLKVGTSAYAPDAALRIGFDGVTADSRCAKGEQCIRAGDVTVRIWWQQGAGARAVQALHLAPDAGQALRVQAHELRLLRVDPHPVTGRPIAAADYVATLTLRPPVDAAPLR